MRFASSHDTMCALPEQLKAANVGLKQQLTRVSSSLAGL